MPYLTFVKPGPILFLYLSTKSLCHLHSMSLFIQQVLFISPSIVCWCECYIWMLSTNSIKLLFISVTSLMFAFCCWNFKQKTVLLSQGLGYPKHILNTFYNLHILFFTHNFSKVRIMIMKTNFSGNATRKKTPFAPFR